MNEETTVVNLDEANIASDQEHNEQVNEQVESDISTTDGKDYKAIAEQLSKDIQAKNRKIQELKGQPQSQVAPVQAEITEDETVRRFIQTEANATIAMKMQTDPSFKDRVDIVQSYVQQGYDISMADKLAKADIMDRILAAGASEAEVIKPKQITPTAIPETTVPQLTGNVLDDIEKGLVDVDPEMAATLKKYRNMG